MSFLADIWLALFRQAKGWTQGLSVLGGVLPISSNGRYGGPYYGGKTDIVGGIRAGS